MPAGASPSLPPLALHTARASIDDLSLNCDVHEFCFRVQEIAKHQVTWKVENLMIFYNDHL
uniref:Uncharacterized protein n=1 Tax=Oryza punctata TaxID=4537 RepID=A0A0E0KJC9_ORYPU